MTTGPGRPGAWPRQAAPSSGHAPPGRLLRGQVVRARRPAVLDAGRVSIIPLRPLTITEILDAAFVVIRANPRSLLGLPFVVAGAAATFIAVMVVAWVVLGNTTGVAVLTVLIVLTSLLASVTLSLVVAWMTAVISRATLHTALGPGFAPAPRWSWRESRAMFWPMAGLALLQSAALSIVQFVAVIVFYLFAAVALVSSSVTGLAVSSALSGLVTFVLYAALSSYVMLTVPAWSVESAGMPGWIGKPQRATNIATAFVRAVSLIGWRNLPRATAVVFASLGLSLLVAGAVFVALLLLVLLYSSVMGLEIASQLIAHPWLLLAAYGGVSLVTLSGLVAFNASSQTLLYLDLRMRRDGLDLALRFDDIDPPQPSAPPRLRYVLAPMPRPPVPRRSGPPAGARPSQPGTPHQGGGPT